MRCDFFSVRIGDAAPQQHLESPYRSLPCFLTYRHLVDALKRKPGAFARWVLRDAASPRAVYRQTWERLSAHKPEREACKTMVGLLVLAADGHEAQLAQELEQLVELNQLSDLGALSQLLAPPKGEIP